MLRDIQYFFQLSRPLNVAITVLAFSLACFLATGNSFSFIQDIPFWASTVALAVISATGYWVNDAFDFKIDRINKPKKVIVNAQLSVKKVLTSYFVANALVVLGSVFFQPLVLVLVNVTAMALLFLYAWILKRTTVIGNIVIATLTATVVYYAALLYIPRTSVMWLIMFAFELTFIREVVKDAEDIKGDLEFKLQTLPIRIGLSATKRFLQVCYLFFILSCYLPIIEGAVRNSGLNLAYLLCSIVLVQLPAAYLLLDIGKAEHTEDFAKQSKWLKFMIFLGMLLAITLA